LDEYSTDRTEFPSPSTTGERPIDKTALSYWFPKIEAAGLPVPRTAILRMPVAAQESIWAGFDGKDGTPEQYVALRTFFDGVVNTASGLGYPCFLRTDHTSGKHRWRDTCFLRSGDDVPSHVFSLAEFSECSDIIGLPWDTWAVREYLPIIPFGNCPRYGDMPICREFRFFVDGGNVRCCHPYWPREALTEGGAHRLDYAALCEQPAGYHLHVLASAAGRAVGGAWSVDLLETQRGWYITDMAEAEKSFHWEGCCPHG
jgi:hypothetical protein